MVYAPHDPWLAGEKETAAKLQTLTDAFKEIGDPWTAYTPVLTATTTNPNVGSTGSVVGQWVEANKTIWGHIRITFAGTGVTVGSGNYLVTVPVNVVGTSVPRAVGSCVFERGGTHFARTPFFVNANQLGMVDGLGNRLGSTTAWAAGDEIDIEFMYEAA
ncbi:MAG TPA: hypothetical protein VFB74_30705 [Kribbellaceae bacterium]|nr:hypothetical protein [Kribbellaceae bacterium]